MRLREVRDLQESALAIEGASRTLGGPATTWRRPRPPPAAYAMGAGIRVTAATLPARAIDAAEAAVADAEARIADAEHRIGICEAAAGILDPLAARLARALEELRTVPQDLGEVYELVYAFVRSGGSSPLRPLDRRGAHVRPPGTHLLRPKPH